MKQGYRSIFFIVIVYLLGNYVSERWKTTLLFGDSNGYYMHVVSFFINQDVGSYDKTIESLLEADPRTIDARQDPYGIRLTSKGRRYIKYTLGAALMETPFFLIAHTYAKVTKKYPANGWSLPYLFMVSCSTIFYLIIGFYLLYLSLIRYFPAGVSSLVIIGLALATNLYFHVTSLTMAHGFLFFDYCALLYFTIRFYESPNNSKAIILGAIVGLITLTRVPEVISVLIPLLWGIKDSASLRGRWRFLVSNPGFFIYALLSFCLVFSIQIIYWHYVSGQLIFNPYQGEGFNFLKPQILKGWFHFKNGWLIYTPFMGLSLIGWFLLRKQLPEAQLAIFAVVGLISYVHYSYYVWAYFPGLGSRPMIETYPLLGFGLAAFFVTCQKHKLLRWIPVSALFFFGLLNVFQSWQMDKGLIWTERGNFGFYWESLGMTRPTLESLRAFDSAEIQPDTTHVSFFKNIFLDDFEDSSKDASIPLDTSHVQSGRFSLLQTNDQSGWVKEIPLLEAKNGDWIRPSISAFMKAKDKIWNRNESPDLIVELYNNKGELKKWTNLKLSCHINTPGKENYSIWYSGVVDRWDEAAYFIRLPRGVNKDWKLKAYILNFQNKKLYLDDFRVDLYRRQ